MHSKKTNPEFVGFHKLLRAAGTCAYFISPKGAEKLLTKLFHFHLNLKNPTNGYRRLVLIGH